jgi:putative endonuclease
LPKAAGTKCFWIYILECDDGSYYTGYTVNLARRYRQHVEGKAGVRYTRSHRPVRIAQCWRLFGDVGTALKVESLIKRRNRPTKDRLVENPENLKLFASGNLSRRLRIYTADPADVQNRSMAMTPDDVKNGFDPFAGAPAADM